MELVALHLDLVVLDHAVASVNGQLQLAVKLPRSLRRVRERAKAKDAEVAVSAFSKDGNLLRIRRKTKNYWSNSSRATISFAAFVAPNLHRITFEMFEFRPFYNDVNCVVSISVSSEGGAVSLVGGTGKMARSRFSPGFLGLFKFCLGVPRIFPRHKDP